MYPITMSFTVSTPAELARLVAATTGDQSANAQTPKPEVKKQEVKKPDPKSEKAEAAESAPPAATPVTPEPTAAASGGDLEYERDVKPAFLKLVQTKGRAAGRKIIDAFAPTKDKLSEAISTPEQFAQALKLIAKEMG